MLLAADVTTRAVFQATDHDVIQRVGGGVEMFSFLLIPTEFERHACKLRARRMKTIPIHNLHFTHLQKWLSKVLAVSRELKALTKVELGF